MKTKMMATVSIVLSLIFGACTPSSPSEYPDFPLEKKTEYLRKTKITSYVLKSSLKDLHAFSHATFYDYFDNSSDALKAYNAVQISLKQNAPRVFFECDLFLSVQEDNSAKYAFSVFCNSLAPSCASNNSILFERYFLESVSMLDSEKNSSHINCEDI